MFTNNFKELMNSTVYTLIIELLNTKTEFSIIVSSKNWDKPLPDNLKNQEFFIIQIKEQTLEDSYYDESTNEIYISTEFNNIPNSITLFAEDVKGIMDISMQIPILTKPYNEEPKYVNIEKARSINKDPLVYFKDEELTAGVKHSIDCFVKYNPNLFGG